VSAFEERVRLAGDAARLLRDIRSIQDPVAVATVVRANGELPGPLLERLVRERGWDEERIRAALVAIRNGTTGDVRLSKKDYQRVLAERVARTASAGAVPRGTGRHQPRPSSPSPVDTPPVIVASAMKGRRLIADDLSALTGSGGPQRAGGFALRHFAGDWWLCRAVGGGWENTGYAARGGRWWRWAKGTLMPTNLPALSVRVGRGHGLVDNTTPDRLFQPDQAPVDRREYPAGSRTRLPANRRSSGGRGRRAR
jgi:hypothetical protein